MSSDNRKKIKFILDIILSILGAVTVFTLITVAGYYIKQERLEFFKILIDIIFVVFIAQEFLRWFLVTNFRQYIKFRWIENLLAVFVLLSLIFPQIAAFIISIIFPELTPHQLTLVNLTMIALVFIIVITIRVLRHSDFISKINIHPGAVMSLSFMAIIIVGALLLMLPRAAPQNKPISAVDAFFTSTSAVCVTGLITLDTEHDFTPLGKIIIIMLVQVGGLGVMTLTTFFAALFAGGMSMRVSVLMSDLLSNESVGDVFSILGKILSFTLVIELIGALILYFSRGYSLVPFNKLGFYYAAFHSVSAFCNAGFSLYSEGLMKSGVSSNFIYLGTIMMLIILGGLGFMVMDNILGLFIKMKDKRRLRYRMRLNTKIVLITTIFLIVAGTLFILSVDKMNFHNAHTWYEKTFHAMFLSVSARTAGFNSVPTEMVSTPAAMIVIILMWIGASPGSTGGGIKTSTFFVSIYALLRQVQGKERIELFNREISFETVHTAFFVIMSSLIVLGAGTTLLIWMEPDKQAIDLIFEATSALGTVGLSRDITMHVGTGAKIVLIGLMYVGRIGVFAFFLSLYRPKEEANYQLPKEQILVG